MITIEETNYNQSGKVFSEADKEALFELYKNTWDWKLKLEQKGPKNIYVNGKPVPYATFHSGQQASNEAR